MREYTFGMEFEMADIDRNVPPPAGCKFSSDFDLINSCGLAIDPAGKLHKLGGEVITPPGKKMEVLRNAKAIFATYPNAKFNHRTVLHCHASWPELVDDVEAMKKILSYQQQYGREAIDTVWPHDKVMMQQMNRSALAFYIYDFTIMPEYKYNFCMQATTPQEFRQSYAKTKNGIVNWLHAKRYALNMYSIFKHGTIEFRHWFPTKDVNELLSVMEYCEAFIENALGERLPIKELLAKNSHWKFPVEDNVKYDHALELCWQDNNFHTNTREIATARQTTIMKTLWML